MTPTGLMKGPPGPGKGLWETYFSQEFPSSKSSDPTISNVAHASIENAPKPIPPGAPKHKYRTLPRSSPGKVAISEGETLGKPPISLKHKVVTKLLLEGKDEPSSITASTTETSTSSIGLPKSPIRTSSLRKIYQQMQNKTIIVNHVPLRFEKTGRKEWRSHLGSHEIIAQRRSPFWIIKEVVEERTLTIDARRTKKLSEAVWWAIAQRTHLTTALLAEMRLS